MLAQIPDLEAVRQELARRRLRSFLEYDGQGHWRTARHLELLCEKLEAVERGEIKRLMVCMPPRHGKSEVVSKKYPAWYLGRNPWHEVILTSYSAELAADFSRIARGTLRDRGDLWGVKVASDSAAVGRWGIEGTRGGLVAAGVGGPITGRGAHLAIIDDPVKNAEEANSAVIRERVWQWYQSTLRTRLAPGGAIVLVMTRWHEDDLAGRLLRQMEQGGEQWEVVCMPALAEEDDPLGRAPGEPLWPERGFDARWAAETRTAVGSYVWAALYQQRPSPSGGGFFKRSWFRYFSVETSGSETYYVLHGESGDTRVLASKCWRFTTTDPAATQQERSDYFVTCHWGVTPDKDLLLLDLFREKAETTRHRAIMENLYRSWRPSQMFVEDRTYGLAIIQDCKRLGLPIRPLKADTDKVSRARPVQARYEIGTVYHREGAPWLADLEAELLAFPHGEHDDQVDCVAYAGLQVVTGGGATVTAKPKGW